MAQTIPPIPGQVITPPDPRKAAGSMTDPWYAWFNAFKGFVAGGGSGGTPGPNSITNAQLAQAARLTVKCNPTNATANEQDLGPAAANQVLQSNAAGNALVWGPFGTGVQVRGATWTGGNAAILLGSTTDVSVVNPIDMQVSRVSITTKGGTGSCVCDVWTSPVASYPPTAANTIFTVLPSISSGIKYDDVALGGLSTTHIPAGNVLTFHLVSTSLFTEIVLNLALTPTQTVASSGYTDAQAVAAVKAAFTNSGNVISSGAVGAITMNTGLNANPWGSQSLAQTGYMTFPNGLIHQWGRLATTGAGPTADFAISFPLTFPTACWNVQVTGSRSVGSDGQAGNGSNFVSNISASGCTITIDSHATTNYTGYWFATGN